MKYKKNTVKKTKRSGNFIYYIKNQGLRWRKLSEDELYQLLEEIYG